MATKLDLVVSMVLDDKGVAVGFRDAKNRVRDLQGQFLKLNDTMTEVSRGTEQFTARQGELVRAVERQTKATGSANTATGMFKNKIDDLFKPITTLNQAFGLLQQSLYVLQRAFDLTVGSAIDLELQVARITTVIEDAEIGQVDFAKQILQMQATFGANPTEAAMGFYESIASGATNAAGSIELMATAQKLAVGGLLPLDKALSGLTSVMASYGYEANQTKYISDGFFIAAAKGKTNVEELTMEIGNVSSIAQQAGVSFEELVSAISAVTLGGKRTAEATTSVRSAINALLTPTEQLQYVYDQLNIKSVTQEIRQRGLAAVYKDIYGYVNNNAEALSKLVGRVEAISGVVAITTGKQAKAYEDMVSSITDSNKAMGESTDRAFNLIEKSSSKRLDIAKGKIAASFTDISQIIMRAVVPVMEALASAINAALKPIVFVTDVMEKFVDTVQSGVIPAMAALTGVFLLIKTNAVPAIITLGIAIKGMIAPILVFSAKLLAIGAAVGIVIASIDSFIRNWELIPVAFDYIIAKLEQTKIKMFMLINDLFLGLANIISENSQKFPKIANFFGLDEFAEKSKSQLGLVNEQFGKEMDEAVQRAEDAKKKISSTFDAGAFGVLLNAAKDIKNAFSGISDKVVAPPKIGAPDLGGITPKAAPDLPGMIEERNKLQEQLNTILNRTAEYEKEIELSKYYGNDLTIKTLEIEFDKIDALAAQLDAHKALTKEQLIAIDKYKETAARAIEIKIDTDNIKKATDFVNTAASGANSFVTKTINEVGAAFGPKGELVAGIINFLRMGKETLSQFGNEITKIIIELPLKIAEGAIGLVEGLLQGVIDMLADPARLAKIVTALTNLVPNLITAIAKALPAILKVLLSPEFWKEFISQLIRSTWEAIKEMFIALGKFIKSIFTGEIFDGVKESVKDMGTSIGDGIKDATKSITGFTQQLFGVQEDVAAGPEDKDPGSSIRKAFDYGKKVTGGIWNDIKKVWDDFWNLVRVSVEAPFKLFLVTLGGVMRVFGAVVEGVGKAFKLTFDVTKMAFESTWKVIKTSFTTVFETGKIIFNGIKDTLISAWDTFKNVFMAVWNFAKSIFNGVIDSFKAVFNFFKKLFDDPIGAFKQLLEDFKKIFSNLWDSFKEIPKKLWDGIKEYASIARDTFKEAGKRVWEGLKEVWEEIKNFFKDAGKKVWEGLKEIWNDLVDSFKKLGSSIWEGLKQTIKDIGGAIAKFFGFAQGGVVPGVAKTSGDSSSNDVVPAMLSPGEAVIPRSLMADPQINAMIRNLLESREMPITVGSSTPRLTMANGGIVPIIGGGSTSYGDTNVNVVLKIDTKEPLDESFVRQRLIPAIKSELKASSLRGDFVLSAKGVRK